MALEVLRPLENLATILKAAGENLAAAVVWVARNTTAAGTFGCGLDQGCTIRACDAIVMTIVTTIDRHSVVISTHGLEEWH